MDTRKWPWKKRSSDKSCGESESSESISSHSERFSDDQESMKEIVNDKSHSPEVTSPATIADDEVKESVKSLAEKLSAALVNVSAKEDLVKQHAKVAEEAVAGWEKAENEVAALKQQLESAVQQNVNLEVKNSHLDGALKECVRQLRQARDEHEKRASDERNKEWESKRVELEKQILELKKENSFLKEELEVVRVERDLITKSAETASKLQLESIKKVTKLEAECRRLQSQARKSIDIDSRASTQIDQFKTEKKALTNTLAKNPLQIDMMDDFLEMERLASLPEPDSTDNPLKAELESTMERVAELENMLEKIEAQNSELQNVLDKTVDSLKAAQNRIAEGELRLEELRNELIVAYETKDSLEIQLETMEEESRTFSSNIDSLKAEIEEERKLSASQSLELRNALEETRNELTAVYEAKESLESKLIAMEAESRTLSSSIDETVDSLKAANGRIEEMQNELNAVYEAKDSLESQLITMEAESRTLSSSVDSLKNEIEVERKKSGDLKKKCEELENELSAMIEEYEVQQSMHSNGEVKVKQEDLAVAADKLSECQKTIASLGRQLESLATLEDFFIDTSSIPGLSSHNGAEIWRIHSNGGACVSNYDLDLPEMAVESYSHLPNGIKESSSSSPLATNHVTAAKKWNSFPELFSRSKNGRT